MLFRLGASVLLLCTPASAQTDPVQQLEVSRPSLDGPWTGGMTVPGGIVIRFDLILEGAGGTLSFPDRGGNSVPVTVRQDGPHVSLTVPAAEAAFAGEMSADDRTLAGEWRQGERSFPLRFVRGLAAPLVRPQTPVAPFPYRVEDLQLPGGGGIRLGATLTRPTGDNPVAAVLILGANGPQDRDETYAAHKPMAVIADRLARAGIATLRYDKRGVGRSGGRYDIASAEDFVADAVAALAWLRRQDGVDPSSTCILGLSEGAVIAPIVATTTAPACLLLLSPPGLPGPALMNAQARLAARDRGMAPVEADREGRLAQQLLDARIAGAGVEQLTTLAIGAGKTRADADALARDMMSPEVSVFLAIDPADALSGLTMPILVLSGNRDRQVPPESNLPPIRRALAGKPGAEFVTLSDLNHLLQPATTGSVAEYANITTTIDPRALNEIVRFAMKVTRINTGQ